MDAERKYVTSGRSSLFQQSGSRSRSSIILDVPLGAVLAGVGARPAADRIFQIARALQLGHLRSIVFDQTLPRIVYYWPQERVAELMANAGLEDVRIASVNEMS
jgi:hypothetical protein